MNESMYFLLKMGIFQCHVSFLGGNYGYQKTAAQKVKLKNEL